MSISSISNADSTKNIETAKQQIYTKNLAKADAISIQEKLGNVSEMTDENGQPTKQAYQTAVNKLNEFMEYSQKNSKFVFHDGLEKYYVEIVDAKTDKVIKEIPPKELLDAYYEMQKLIGKMFDKQI
ncbi:flagellar protein FlaG [Rummeliibacillus suwonensis]|uniref:flagellar protein FlaG n=1 Tax=Rummeliibacillus suwonensis TaxID=1306154 RepID=UPI0011B846EB|nr:flagellar protein FlaG [Rummeliibacillus suwonensis]MBO2534275.1 flagellar protein FlaG [Rummeliibacillus suwonensis]